MCVGQLDLDQVTTAAASGIGNPVIYLGSSTGKDGIHGATFASDALGDHSEVKRPNVQIGDPFAEKLLIEATLEALATGAIVAIQDMGAAGLTCSTVEMASQGKVGMSVNLDLVPMRESDMTGYELMLSESQERMLAIAHKGREHEVIEVFRKWGLHAVTIGEVTDDSVVTIMRHKEVVAKLDPQLLTDHCPVYTTNLAIPEYHRSAQSFEPGTLPLVEVHQALLTILSSPDIASKHWVFDQYDQHVQTQTSLGPGQADAAVLALRGTQKGLALKIDGNGRQTYLHPYRGGQLAVVEAARNVACTGATPLGVTDGLNFGDPRTEDVYWQFSEAVKGIADAAEGLGTPVISGNVSFYNQSDLGAVLPTALIGMVGLLRDAECSVGLAPSTPSDLVLLAVPDVMVDQGGLGASAFLSAVHGIDDGIPTAPNVPGEKRLCELLAVLCGSRLISSAHDSSEGGLAVCLAEIALCGGVEVSIDASPSIYMFSEVPGRVIVSTQHVIKVIETSSEFGIEAQTIGKFGHTEGLTISTPSDTFQWTDTELRSAFEGSIARNMSV